MKLKNYLAPVLALVFGLSFVLYGIFSVKPELKSIQKTAEGPGGWPVEKLHTDTMLAAPALMVKNEKELSVPLNTRSLHVDTKIHGRYAETRLDLEFENTNNRVLEGEFYFPLAEKQLISDFQLEINGSMRSGVIVDKDLGRVAFESTVRKKVDPGLLELSKGNVFKARVYPIPANGTKKVSITYVEELATANGTNAYFLPLNYSGKIKEYTCSVSIDNLGQQLQDKANQYTLSGNQFVAETNLKNVMLKNGMQIIQKGLDRVEASFARTTDGDYIVQTSLHPEGKRHPKRQVKSISILLDVSASSEKRSFEKEKEIISSYLNGFSQVNVQLISFSNEVHQQSWRTILSEADISRLLEEMTYQKLDGGTQLGCIQPNQIKGEEVILLSDCLSNLGEDAFPKLIGKRVYVISSNPEFDSRSAQLTAQNGGEFINLNRVGLPEVLEKLNYEQLQFLGIKGAEGITTGIGSFVGSDFSVYSKWKEVPGEFTLLFGTSGKITEQIKVKRNSVQKFNSPGILSKFWSNDYLQELDLESEKNKGQILRLAKANKLVSRYTSLIVLDDLEDYVQYRILPPAQMQKAYFKRLKETAADKDGTTTRKKETKEHRASVLARFEELIRWWKTDFNPIPDKSGQEQGRTVNFVPPNVDESSDMVITAEVQQGSFSGASANVNGATMQWTTASNTVLNESALTQSVVRNPAAGAKIELSNWDPGTPYLKKLKASRNSDVYTTYLALKKNYQNQPSFYVDVSDYFLKIGKKREAIRVLSNISELKMENPQMLRILAHRYEQMGEYKLAISVFETVRKMRPEEPQSYRDLALVYELSKQYSNAFRELKYVITHPWDERFRDIENICLVELNHLIANHKGIAGKLDKKLIHHMPVDIRVVIDWDSDNCDIDLWVTDPLGEKCFYSNSETLAGGRISMDCTGGYGPEEFMIKKAVKGKYIVQANYYGSSAQTLSGLTTIQVKLITNYGKKNEKTQSITRRLEETSEVIDLAEFDFY